MTGMMGGKVCMHLMTVLVWLEDREDDRGGDVR